MVRFRSTRGAVNGASFEEAVMMGLASDRGLIVPEIMPQLPADALQKWRQLPFQNLSYAVMSLFIDESEICGSDLMDIIGRSYKTFRHPDVTPVVKLGDRFVLELFHGPTFAFKDVALQFLGNLFEYFLARKEGSFLTVVGATSGDTGSSAIAGLRGKSNVEAFILFPNGRVSEIQERQMTTVLDANIHNIAIDGTFDDAQAIVKALFADAAFKKRYRLGAVNSINFGRILAQIVYYFYAYFRVLDERAGAGMRMGDKVSFSVPTGNFGDVLAGHYAKRMGLPIDVLLVATNENDVLTRLFHTGVYEKRDVQPSLSPSMDICVSSNLERLLFEVAGFDPAVLSQWMDIFESTGTLRLPEAAFALLKGMMCSARVDKQEALATITRYAEEHSTDTGEPSYILDPHSAVGVAAAEKTRAALGPGVAPMVCLATAHPGKFPHASKLALGHVPTPPPLLAELADLPTLRVELPAETAAIRDFVVKTVRQRGGGLGGCSPSSWVPSWLGGSGEGELSRHVAVVGTVALAVAVMVGVGMRMNMNRS